MLDRARPMLATYCSDIVRVGDVGQGQVAKSVNNLLLWAAATALSEAAELAEARRHGPADAARRHAHQLGKKAGRSRTGIRCSSPGRRRT